MRKRILSVILCALIVSGAAASLSACDVVEFESESESSLPASSTESSAVGGEKTDITETADICDEDIAAVSGMVGSFSTELFKRMYSGGENALVSPFSVYTAFAMLQNGAEGNTLTEMNDVLNGFFHDENAVVCYANEPLSPEVISEYFRAYTQGNADDNELKMANSIWCNGEKIASEKFITDSKTCFNADVFNAPFTEQTSADINLWVSEHTNNMINDLIDNIPPNAEMYLIDALAFQGKWAETYADEDIVKGTFTNSKGKAIETDFLCSRESRYIDNGYATGFVKPYMGELVKGEDGEESYSQRYCFAALLPNEGTTLDDYINNFMTDEDLTSIIKNAERGDVDVRLPKFDFECSYQDEVLNALYNMGMHDAFDEEQADFSKLTDTIRQFYVNNVIHKTKITVDETGTKAAAVTAIEMADNAVELEENVHIVNLNRPFLFVIYDSFENMPIFIGALNTVE